jgi:hypothetical protein
MKTVFRPVEFWKSAVMTMPDISFFELLRSVFGKIKTPFKKQQMINDLETFLLREDIQAAIAAYIDQNDAKVIAATALFGEPVSGELESFFSGEMSYAELQDIIVNLEERFIIYRFIGENVSRLALNPVLEKVLLPFTVDISALFPAVPETGTAAQSAAALDDRILAGLLSFVSQGELFFKAEGVIRKRIIEAGKTCFSGIDLELVFGGLQILGLFYAAGDKLVPDSRLFEDFGSLTVRERGEYCAASLLVYGELNSLAEILPPLYRGRICDISVFIHLFLDSMETGFLYPEKTLKRLAEVIKAETGTEVNTGELIEVLEKTALVEEAQQDLKRLGPLAKDLPEKREGPFIAIDSGFSVLVYPEISYTDVIKLASFMNIKEAGAVVRFELDRDSAVRSFDKNISADEMIELLGRLSGNRVDDALVWNLKDWEKRHREVSLKKGVILTLSEDRRYLTETKPLADMIIETLAPGLYLLNEDSIDEADSALRAAGIDIIARRRGKSKTPSSSTGSHFLSPLLRASREKYVTVPVVNAALKKTAGLKQPDLKQQDESAFSQRAAGLKEDFHAILKKMPLGEVERAELSARIDRRLVLCEAQLREASLRYEKLEARHMDYAGKQNIAKQAIAMQSPVEIVWLGGGKDGDRIFGIPKALEKDNGELVLAVVPADREEVMRIPLAKISLLRRIKKSIFEI